MPASSVARGMRPPVPMGIEIEDALRKSFLRLGGGGDPRASDELAIVEKTAVFLEMLLAGVVAHELVESRAAPLTPPISDADLIGEVESRTRRSLDLVLDNARRYLGLDPKAPVAQGGWMPAASLRRRVRSLLDVCPIEEIEIAAAALAAENWGHRARIAYDELRAFLFRTDEVCQAQLRIAGRAYARGHISVEEVAKLLSIHPVDALALLDQAGFNRSVEQIALSEDERNAIFGRLRDDRKRGGFEPTEEAISRDVVGSERIEGIDARRWIPREGP